jgi:hypothetical protein
VPKPPHRRRPTIDLEANEVASGETDAEPDAPRLVPEGSDQRSPEHTAEAQRAGAESGPAPGDASPELEPADRATRRSGVRPAVVIASAIAGASLAVLAAAIIWGSGLLPPSVRLANSEATAPLVQKIDLLDHRVAELEARPAPAPQSKVDDLEKRLAKIEASPPPAAAAQVADIDARVQKLETAAATPKPPSPELQGLEARVAKLESAPGAPPAADRGLSDRIAALEQRVTEGLAAVQSTVAQSQAAAAATQQAAAARADAAESAMATLAAAQKAAAGKADAAEAAAAAVRKDVDSLSGRMAALEQSAKALDQRLSGFAKVAASDRAVRLGLAALELRMAVDRGLPFTAELGAVKELAPDQHGLDALEPFVQTGVPSTAALAQELSKLGPAIGKAVRPAEHDGGLLAQLEERAGRLVQIRPVNAQPGDDPGAVVARAEAAAARGDISGAVGSLDRLPDEVRAPAAGWIKTAQAREAAMAAARQLSASAMAALGAPAQ